MGQVTLDMLFEEALAVQAQLGRLDERVRRLGEDTWALGATVIRLAHNRARTSAEIASLAARVDRIERRLEHDGVAH